MRDFESIFPAGTLPGQRAMNGTPTPPSKSAPLYPLRPPVIPFAAAIPYPAPVAVSCCSSSLVGREARAVGRFRGDPPSCASPRRHHGHAGAAEPPAADPPAGAGDVAGMRRPRRVRLLRRERSGDPHVAGHLRVPRDVPASALRRAAAQVTHLLRQAAAA